MDTCLELSELDKANMNAINLDTITHIHFTGIKGVAMTALAIIAKQKGKSVSGSDIQEVFPTDETLAKENIAINHGFKPENIPVDTDLLIYTGAHQGRNNPEVKFAIAKGIPILPQGRALGLFMAGKRQISVAGSHGKTTTSALVATILESAGYKPSFAVGCGAISHLKTNGRWGSGEYFIAEADEYVTDPVADPTPRFLWQKPEILIITNIDFDHPDVYKDLQAVQAAFVKLIQKMSDHGVVILNADDEPSRMLLPHITHNVVTFGTHPDCTYRITNIDSQTEETRFMLENKSGSQTYILTTPGRHNVFNAAAAIIAATHINMSSVQIQKGLSDFVGTKRRFELIAQKNGKLLFDDYAHHPHEISATLQALKQRYPKKRLVIVFQPHTYSRTQALFAEFAVCFKQADEVIITDIYASAREAKQGMVTGELLAAEIRKNQSHVSYCPDRTSVLKYMSTQTHDNDVIMTMGAGDIFTWLPDLAQTL